MPLLPPLRDVIARHQLAARRALGQHFLLDGNLTTRIAAAAGPLDGRHVIEVGPGPGGLTRALLACPTASVTVVEVDRRAIGALEELRACEPDRLRIVEADALKIDLTELAPAPRQLVANLPYNIATPLLIGWLRHAASFERMTLMFQLEVALRLAAPVGSPDYGRLSVLAQWLCDVTLLFRLSPSAFVPPPKVFSAVVSLLPHAVQPCPAQIRAMEALTQAAFGQRRKMLRASLRAIGGEALLRRADIAPERRAETLSVGEFERLLGETEKDRGAAPDPASCVSTLARDGRAPGPQ